MDDDVVNEFLAESNTLLDDLDRRFAALVPGSNEPEAIAAIFRGLHTIKGSCGFLGYARLEKLTHAGEGLFSKIRDGERSVDEGVVAVVAELGEAIRNALAIIEGRGDDTGVQAEALIKRLKRLHHASSESASEAATPPAQVSEAVQVTDEGSPTPKASTGSGTPDDATAAPAIEVPEPAKAGAAADTASPSETSPSGLADSTSAAPSQPVAAPPAGAAEPAGGDRRTMGEILVSRGICKPEHIVLAVREQQKGDPRRLGEILVERGHCSPADVKAALETQGEHQAKAVAENSIRVDVSLLDKLMNLVGELVLARNQVQQFTTRTEDQELLRASSRLNLITTELQEGVMKTRMQPVGNVWGKFPRVVRHLAVICDKEVRVEMEGQDTELDKTILEAIKDPLTHFVRNAVDHGVEKPAVRLAAGKPAMGTIFLRAFHEGGQVNMEISDDGGGINLEAVRNKALDRGLINSVQAARMTDRDIAMLVFEPGFSTAEAVTSVSGRGVGMDVVKTNIERIGGSIDLLTERGKGTTLKVKIPLTLAIIPVLLVSSGARCYALPQVSLVELVRLEGKSAQARIEWVQGAPVYRLRGSLLPLVHLNEVLKERDEEGRPNEVLNIVVLQADDRQFGLVVDEVRDTAEIVVKPVGKALKSVPVFAGATILGDGSVSLILDVLGLAQHARIVEEVRERSGSEMDAVVVADDVGVRERILLFNLGERRRFATSLDLIGRLEEFPRTAVEVAGGRPVIQYRESILPLVCLAQALGVGPSLIEPGATTRDDGDEDLMTVLVYDDGQRRVGLVVGEILDIIEDELVIQPTDGPFGIAGSIIVRERVTDLVDVPAILKAQGGLRSAANASEERISA